MLRKPSLADSRRGFTLVELLVAMVLSMMLILAISRYFKFIGDTVRDGRAALEMAGQLHSATIQLDRDVNHLTAMARPGGDISANAGYLEIVEGEMCDLTATLYPRDPTDPRPPDLPVLWPISETDETLGDVDDILAFTAVSDGHPFSGQIDGRTIYSTNAEIIYWLTLNDKNSNRTREYGENYILHRRVLLIAPNVNLDAYSTLPAPAFFNIVDISCHHDGTNWVANNLTDLSRRENRFAHVPRPAAFPNVMLPVNIPVLSGLRHGDDILMSHILAFDVRVFDPTAQIHSTATVIDAVAPGDPGWPAGNSIGRGAFVDLNYLRYTRGRTPLSGASVFARPPNVRSGLNRVAVYDTWSTSYERDGIDQNGNRIADEGTNGIDDNNARGVDDASEQETVAPYPVPLRGIQITVRTIDNDTRQVQQVIVTANFTP